VLPVIERQIEQITHLVDDLLDLSRIASGKLEVRTQVIETIAEIVREPSDQHRQS
jgi:signal transduction histidine kinase